MSCCNSQTHSQGSIVTSGPKLHSSLHIVSLHLPFQTRSPTKYSPTLNRPTSLSRHAALMSAARRRGPKKVVWRVSANQLPGLTETYTATLWCLFMLSSSPFRIKVDFLQPVAVSLVFVFRWIGLNGEEKKGNRNCNLNSLLKKVHHKAQRPISFNRTLKLFPFSFCAPSCSTVSKIGRRIRC